MSDSCSSLLVCKQKQLGMPGKSKNPKGPLWHFFITFVDNDMPPSVLKVKQGRFQFSQLGKYSSVMAALFITVAQR